MTDLPTACDYLIVGGGATGMAFADTLLSHHEANTASVDNPQKKPKTSLSVVMLDQHASPGGQWHDSYHFVRLHQPSAMYGVESIPLEPDSNAVQHRATRQEILDYYSKVQDKLQETYDFRFCGNATFDFASFQGGQEGDFVCQYTVQEPSQSLPTSHNITVRKRVVDARFLQPDLPINTPPKFRFNADAIRCVPVNQVGDPDHHASSKYVVIGAGKTGMDCVVYLQMVMNIKPDNIVWVVPHEAWITARENIGNCMQFLHTCCQVAKDQQDGQKVANVETTEFLQNGFLQWEKVGFIYRFHKDILPTKFKDATLDQEEMEIILRVKNVLRNGRVREISDHGELVFEDGSVVPLPWKDIPPSQITFVHCSAGAFNYTKQPESIPPVFDKSLITIQDVYGTPGFCFVGSILAKLECQQLSDEDRNSMCLSPQHNNASLTAVLGPSGGEIGNLSRNHGLLQRLSNVRAWYNVQNVAEWLNGHRLFNLGLCSTDEAVTMLNETWQLMKEAGLVTEQ